MDTRTSVLICASGAAHKELHPGEYGKFIKACIFLADQPLQALAQSYAVVPLNVSLSLSVYSQGR